MIDATGMPQSALLLGGTSEIGLAILEELASARLERVVLVGRDPVGLGAARRRLEARAVTEVAELVCDITVPSDVAGLPARAEAEIGPVDLAVVSVGDLGTADLFGLDAARVAEMFAVNTVAPASAAAELGGAMARQGYGRIVVISSVAAVRVRRANFAYGAGKAGLDAFAQGLAEALRPYGVGVTIVRPGFVRTKMTRGLRPPPFSSDVETVARAVADGLSSGAAVVYVPPSLRLLSALLRVLPNPIFRRLPG
jgi:decaprenylphospho-beta-D-erythro-pentofuranosid-2-ulose 2-reductase